jgi:hypothetical protein
MGVESRCCPCHSTAHLRHMKRQPCLCHHHPCHGRCHSDCRRHLCRHRRLHHHCRCRCPSLSPSAIAVAVAVDHRRCPLCHHRPLPLRSLLTIAAALSVALPSAMAVTVAVTLTISHCRLHHRWPPQLPSLLAITVTIAVGHFRELLPWCGENCIQPIEAKNAHLILFCSNSGQRTDQSQMTDQVLSGNGQHQHWAASGEQ